MSLSVIYLLSTKFIRVISPAFSNENAYLTSIFFTKYIPAKHTKNTIPQLIKHMNMFF